MACWRMSRPAQLALIGLVYLLGVAMAGTRGSAIDGPAVGAGAFGLLTVALTVHYGNEYADYETDALTERTRFSGGSGALQDLELPRSVALRATAVSGVVAVLAVGALGVLATALARSLLPVGILATILVLGWQYSLGPLQLAWRGLGELVNAGLGGLALPLYGFAVVAGTVDLTATLAMVPFALVVLVNLFETQYPDRSADAAVGKATLTSRLSDRALRRLYAATSLGAVAALLVLWGSVLPTVVVMPSLVVLLGLGWGLWRFTSVTEPFPAVATMVTLAAVQTAGWTWIAIGG